jgi:hypothetical protein
VKEVVLREEEPPDDTVVVVRGGEMNSAFIRRTAQRSVAEWGYFAVSVFLTLDDPVDVLCAMEPYVARYGQVRLTTVGRLRHAGFPLLPTLHRPHYDVVLPDLEDQTLDRLETAFDQPIPNPGRHP